MSTTHHYEVKLQWLTNRMGVLSSLDLEETITVATPPEFPGGIAGIWSPEHLFVAAVSSCFMTTFLAVAEKSRLNFKHFSCAARGKLELVDKAYQITEVTLTPRLSILSAKDYESAINVLKKSEQHCLISNSIRSKIILEPKIEAETLTVEV